MCCRYTLAAPIAAVSNDSELQEEADYLMEVGVPVTGGRLQQYQAEQETDPICTKVRKYCVEGWPDERKNRATSSGHNYWKARTHLLISQEGLLLFRNRIAIPKLRGRETLNRIHDGHQGGRYHWNSPASTSLTTLNAV